MLGAVDLDRPCQQIDKWVLVSDVRPIQSLWINFVRTAFTTSHCAILQLHVSCSVAAWLAVQHLS
jgi:hypothetical protein